MTTNDLASTQEDAVQVLVIGAGIAGLLTARVLSEYYDRILIVERDVFPVKPEPRPGTPQSYHIHHLLPRGMMILERLFPGFIDALLAQGGYPGKDANFTFTYQFGVTATIQVPEKDASCSRDMLEGELRQRVQALPHVRFLTGQEVIGLQMSPDRSRVTSVLLRERGKPEQRTTIKAELVVDASGRSSKLAEWLHALDYTQPEPEEMHVSIGYSTRYYQAPPRFVEQRDAFILTEGAPEKKSFAAALAAIENNTLIVTLGSVGRHPYPPTDVAPFEQALAQLTSQPLIGALQGAEPLTPPRGYRIPAYVRQRYEQMENWPAGLLILGDAFCNFDPLYGQGITVAALEAEALAFSLQEQQQHPQPDFERRMLQRMQEIIEPAWWLSGIADFRWPGVSYVGPRPLQGVKLLHTYIEHYVKYALEHPEVLKPGDEPDLSSPRPTYLKYQMMNGLTVPPLVVFNEATFALLLEAEAATEGPRPLHELTQEYQLSLKEILAQVLPSFEMG